MTYTDMWTNINTPSPNKNQVKNPYKNLNDMEWGYIDALAFAIAHWPADRKCLPDGAIHTHSGDTSTCHYQYVLNIYSDLHIKEYGE